MNAAGTTVRALTLNLWGEQPPLQQRMARVVQGLGELSPDVVALQEVRAIPGQVPNQAEALAAALGYHHVFAAATEWGGGTEGLALLSRLPLSDGGHVELPHATEKERRILLWAFVEAPDATLALFCTHLNYRLTHGIQREDQVRAIDLSIERVVARRRRQAGDRAVVTLLMGDFNATPDSDEMRYLGGRHSLKGRRTYYQDAYLPWDRAIPGLTWSSANPFTGRLRWLEPDRRLDYIYVSPMTRDGRGQVLDCRVVLDQPGEDGVFASDHFGVLAEVQVSPLRP